MPYLAARLLGSRSVGMKRALRKLLYGNGTALDVTRLKALMASFGRYKRPHAHVPIQPCSRLMAPAYHFTKMHLLSKLGCGLLCLR